MTATSMTMIKIDFLQNTYLILVTPLGQLRQELNIREEDLGHIWDGSEGVL